MLIEYGNTVVQPTWELIEDVPTGYARIYHVLGGKVTYEADDAQCQLKPGYLYVLPSTRPYHVWRDKSVDFSCTYLHVDFVRCRVNGLIEMPVQENTCLCDFISAIRRAISEERIELVEQLSEAFSLFLQGHEHFVENSQMLSRIQEYVMQHMSEDMTVESLSRLFSYHPNYFIRLFRQETGHTPYQYIVQMRMQYAVNLLNRGLPNEEVCYICGYTDSSSFTRAFRKYYGVAPQKYRKGYRKP